MHQQAQVKTGRVSAGLNKPVSAILLFRQTKSRRCIIKIRKNPGPEILAFRFKHIISIHPAITIIKFNIYPCLIH